MLQSEYCARACAHARSSVVDLTLLRNMKDCGRRKPFSCFKKSNPNHMVLKVIVQRHLKSFSKEKVKFMLLKAERRESDVFYLMQHFNSRFFDMQRAISILLVVKSCLNG